MLIICLSGIASSWIFIETMENVWFQERIVQLDVQIIQWLQTLHTPLTDQLFLGITQLGNPFLLMFIAIITTATLLFLGRKFESMAFGAGFAGLTVMVMSVKYFLDRHRPSEAVQLVIEKSPAFPSGHASMSLFVYVSLGYLIARTTHNAQKEAYILVATIALTLAIGFSRLYLAAHWPSDVIGGFALAGMWLSALALAIEIHHNRETNS